MCRGPRRRAVLGVLAVGLLLALPPQTPAADEADAGKAARIAKLIAQLGDNDYYIRQRAQDELASIGIEAFDALTAAETHEDLEIAHRARYLVRLMRIDWIAEDDPPAIKRLLDGYEAADEEARHEVIRELARLPDSQGLPVLCRLLRFEKSQVLSKRAALEILEQKQPSDDASWQVRADLLDRAVGQSPRPAAQWVRAYVQSHTQAEAAAEAWQKLAEAEAQTLAQFPQHTHSDIVMRLWRQAVAVLRQLDRRDEAAEAMLKMVALEEGSDDNRTLIELLDWLIEQQAWSVVDQAAERFSDRFDQDPVLLYALALARQQQGNRKAAAAAVERALAMNPDNQIQHLVVAFSLQKRGQLTWSEGEYRKAIEIGPAGTSNTLRAQFLLGEMLHDSGNDLPAAKVLEEANAAMEANLNQGRGVENAGRELGTNRSRMHYFFSLEAARQGDTPRQFEHLKQAIEADPLDADVLIALFRLPDLPADWRDKTRRMIRSAADVFRTQIQQAPDDSSPYNQLAWLISNTEGDQHEALRSSLKSLELRPNEPGYLDTLGRCYYALGDLENAVKYQSKAVELEPYSGQMRNQLKLFEDALAAKKRAASKDAADSPSPDRS